MRKSLLLLIIFLLIAGIITPLNAETIAYWRFESGPADSVVPHPVADGTYYESIPDSSGNGNGLSVWDEGSGGYTYKANVPSQKIPQTGAANNYSVRNNGNLPSMWTDTSDTINSITPSEFTVEATFKLENGDYRTIVGRDSYGTANSNASLAAFYLQVTPDNRVA